MHSKWNLSIHRVLATSVAAIVATTSLYAIPKGPCDKAPEVCCEEPKPGPFAFVYPFDKGLACPRDFSAHVDGLAFQAKQDGMAWVIRNSNGGQGSAVSIANGQVEGFSTDHSDWSYNPGIRFGVGFVLDHDAWGIGFDWTWLNITNYKSRNSSTAGELMIPEFATGIGTPSPMVGYRTSAVWKTSYNTLDAFLGKGFHVSRYLVLNPHFGLRAGWIDQHFSVDYSGLNSLLHRFVHHSDNNFWGVGARMGLNSEWILGKGWNLFTRSAFSMLFSKFEITQQLKYPTSIDNADGFDLEENYYQNAPNFEMAIGLAWGRHFNKQKYHVSLKAAYEFHEWFDQLNIRKFFSGAYGLSGANSGTAVATDAYANDTVSRGNLTLNGFSLRLELDI